VVEIEERNAVGAQPRGGTLGAGDRAPEASLGPPELVDEAVGRCPRSDTDDRALDEVGDRRVPRRGLQLILGHVLSRLRTGSILTAWHACQMALCRPPRRGVK